jgi:DNA-binding MarR family transcriptional regulator
MQLLYIAAIARGDLQPLADELSQRWHELGAVLRSRKLLAALHPASNLTPSKLRALDLLAEHGALRIGELADGVGVDDTTATRLVDRLEDFGLAERRIDSDDRRATTVELTQVGEQLVAELAGERQQFFCDVLAALEPDERSELVRLTAKAAEALQARTEELANK